MTRWSPFRRLFGLDPKADVEEELSFHLEMRTRDLGAGRNRLLRQLLTEAVVLGVTGGALGMALAYGATKVLVAAQPADIPRLEQVGVNGTVLIFTLTVALCTSLIVGLLVASAFVASLWPARRAARLDPSRALRES